MSYLDLSYIQTKICFTAAIFFTTVAGLSAMIGFGTTLVAAKKQDAKYFNKGLVGTKEMGDSGANLALRALGWGTVFAFGGCGILFYTIWKISGAKDVIIIKNCDKALFLTNWICSS